MVQVNVDANSQNILGDAANEPSLAIDPVNPNNITIGWRQFDNVNSNFRQAGWGYSTDAGVTWTFPGVIEPGIFRSDPVLGSDAQGGIYYNSLTSDGTNYYCKVFKSDNGGAAWNSGADAHGGDKQWMTIDNTSGIGAGYIYSSWTSYYSSCSPGFFTRSVDGGSFFEDCVEVDGNPYWGTMTVGNEGELYIAGSGGYGGAVVVKSTSAQYPGTILWDFAVPVELDGYISSGESINPVGLVGQASIDVDRSNGPGRGNIYVLSSVVRFYNTDSADVMFAKSTDGGQTWSAPHRINDDQSTMNYQWFGTMSVAPNGRIDAIWLDTRDSSPGTLLSALYYSYSTDQGETWSPNEKLSDSFDSRIGWPQQNKMGDYFDMESDETSAHLAWANTLNGEQDVYYSVITPDVTGIAEIPGNSGTCTLSGSPNPFSDQVTIRYSIPAESPVSLSLINIYGKEVRTLVSETRKGGSYTASFSADDLPAGYYMCRLTAGTMNKTIGLVRIKE